MQSPRRETAIASLSQNIRTERLNQVLGNQVLVGNALFQLGELLLVIAVVYDHVVASSEEPVVFEAS